MDLDQLMADPDEGFEGEASEIYFEPPPGEAEWRPVDEWEKKDWAWWLGKGHGWSQERIDQYYDIDRYEYGFGIQRHPSEPKTWFYLPGPAAIPLHKSRAPNILYGGAAGGMKSHSTRWDAYRHCFGIPDFRSLIMRRTHEELKRNHFDRARGECERINKFYGDEVMELIGTDHEIRFKKNNSKLIFGHCQNLGDEEKYLGDEYDEFRPDEVATFLKEQIIGVSGRLRSVKHGDYGRVVARMIGTSNPGGDYTLWLKRWFIDKIVSRAENPKYRPQNYEFIGAKLWDNPYLMDPDGSYTTYEERLYAYSVERRKQLLLGDWTAITGQFFTEWKESTHIRKLDIPAGCKIERWIDWGYSPNPGVCHWVACFPNGRLYVFAEWVFNGEGRRLHVASEVAKKIARVTNEEVLPMVRGRISKSIGDPSMWAKDGHMGESYEETFRRNGVRMVQADNERAMGWGRYRHWLRPHPEDGLGWIVYHPDCKYATRSIPSLVHDKMNVDDVDTDGEDHAADADRYGVMARPTPTTFARLATPLLPWSIKEMLNTLNMGAMGAPRSFGKVG